MAKTKYRILKSGDILLAFIKNGLADVEVEAFQSSIFKRVVETGACGIIIDIAALDVVDSFLASILIDTSEMLHLVGTKVVISGIHPATAITLIELGRGNIGVETALDLDEGMEKLKDMLDG